MNKNPSEFVCTCYSGVCLRGKCKIKLNLRKRIEEYNEDPEGEREKYGDINEWKIELRNLSYMFANIDFNHDISKWNLIHTVKVEGMFQNNRTFNQDISKWKMWNIKCMRCMFYDALEFNQDVSSWEINSKITRRNIENIFRGARKFNHDISRWKLKRCSNYSLSLVSRGDYFYDIFVKRKQKLLGIDNYFLKNHKKKIQPFLINMI